MTGVMLLQKRERGTSSGEAEIPQGKNSTDIGDSGSLKTNSLEQQGDQISQSKRKSTLNYPLEGLMAAAEAPVLWLPDAKSRLTGVTKSWTQFSD